MVKLLVYVLSLIFVTFSVSGIDLNRYFKQNHVWEARFFILILIFSLTYLLANFVLDLTNLNLI